MKKNNIDTRSILMKDIGTALKGFCMGAADVVPGVSGGTMAFILGIYEKLIKAIRSFDLIFLKKLLSFRIGEAWDHVSGRFLLALGAGILTAIFSLARALGWLLQNRPVLIWSFFFGLILASIFVVGRHLEKWTLPLWIATLIGAAGAYVLVGLVPVTTPDTLWFLFMSGAVAICAMILPGISGSFILVLLGKYRYILDAVNNRDILILFIVAMGAVFGLITFVRLLNWLLRKSHDITIAVLTGFMLGSLRKVWPWKSVIEKLTDARGHTVIISEANILPTNWTSEVTVALALMAAGFAVVFFLNFWADRQKRTVPELETPA
ncbi:MAG: DUF368 domain-containing protein [Pseudomonadota bacterium]